MIEAKFESEYLTTGTGRTQTPQQNVSVLFSASLEVQKEMEVEYITMPGWTEDIGNVRKFEDLPEAAQNYVRAVEKYTGLPGECSKHLKCIKLGS